MGSWEAAEKLIPRVEPAPSAAKSRIQNNAVTAALKRCATQNQVQHRVFPEPARVMRTVSKTGRRDGCEKPHFSKNDKWGNLVSRPPTLRTTYAILVRRSER